MTILAHLSDLHLIERNHRQRQGLARQRLMFLSAGSPLEAEARMQRVAASLQAARRGGADHILITGDLTEDGVDSQFELLAEVLHASGIDPQRVTLVPGVSADQRSGRQHAARWCVNRADLDRDRRPMDLARERSGSAARSARDPTPIERSDQP
jgi:3',5'-cyclic AMP phosphodiesterase CpdA